ncbi:MAG: DUF3775 domain-containing protein [Gammaproteobacteria bacterium]|jgi:hypothetical protein
MLDLNPETVEQIIDRAHQYQTRDSMREILDEEDADLESLDGAEFHDPEDPIYIELKSVIDDLEPDQQVRLVALMWLGRGDFDIDDWEQAVSRAGEAWNERTAEYLVHTPLLADYLSDGLEQIQDLDV